MKLFLASEASNPDSLSSLKLHLGGLEHRKVLYIPTAKNGNGEREWKSSNTWKFLRSSGCNLRVLELEDYYNRQIERKFVYDIDVIWVPGGAAGYLMYWIYRTRFDILLKSIIDNIFYVGSSAGAMVASTGLGVCDWYLGEIERGASFIPGLGLVDFEIYPHYKDVLYKNIRKNFIGKKLYLLKDGEQIFVDGGQVYVEGEERIIINK